MTEFDFLVSADVLVDDHDVVLQRVQDELGIPEPKARWTLAPERWGAKWTFARLDRDRAATPTDLEVIAPYQVPTESERAEHYPFIAELWAAQLERIVRLHSTVVATSQFDEVVERLRSTKAPIRVDPPDDVFTFPRLWIGYTPDTPAAYDPTADGGLYLEVLPTEVLGVPRPDGAPHAVPAMRIAARSMLVEDLDDTMTRLEHHLGWVPEEVPDPGDGTRRAWLGFTHPGSARLELVQADAAPGSRAGRFLGRWGTGAYGICLEVRDLGATEADLVRRGTPFEHSQVHDGSGRPCLVVPAEHGLGAEFELVGAPVGPA